MSKTSAQRAKKYTVTLSECELRRLTVYAEKNGIDRPTALARLVRQSLRDAAAGIQAGAEHDPGQLGLFDTVQIDIFNNTSKVTTQ